MPDLVEVLLPIIGVRGSGGKIQYVLTDTPLREHQVGATLRYVVEAAGTP